MINRVNESNTTKHLFSPIKGEICTMYGHSILIILAEEVKRSGPFSIMCDGTQDIILEYQESIVIIYIDEILKVQEQCIGFNSSTSSTGESIENILKETIIGLGLSMSNLRGQCYDGASNMSAVYKGTQALIQKEQPLAYYTDCSSRRQNLVYKSVAQSKDLHGSISIVNDIGVIFSKSGKFRDLYQSIYNDKTRFKSMCPTRWTVRCEVI